MRSKSFIGRTHELRGRHAHDDLRPLECPCGIFENGDGLRNAKPGQELGILAPFAHRGRDVFGVRPQRDLVAAAPRQTDGERGPPGAASHNGNAAHTTVVPGFAARDLPKRYSVPLVSRPMFW